MRSRGGAKSPEITRISASPGTGRPCFGKQKRQSTKMDCRFAHGVVPVIYDMISYPLFWGESSEFWPQRKVKTVVLRNQDREFQNVDG